MKFVRPKNMDRVRFEVLNEVVAVIAEETLIAKHMFERTVHTWRRKPGFTFEIKARSGLSRRERVRIWSKVMTEHDIYFFITHGTRIRWALMSADFKAKTNVRFIGSDTGQGRAVLVGKRAMQAAGIPPRPGIKAREFDLEIQERRQRVFPRKMAMAVARGVRNGMRQVKQDKTP